MFKNYIKFSDHLVCRRIVRLEYGRVVDVGQGSDVYSHIPAAEGKMGMWHKLANGCVRVFDIGRQE